MANHASAEKRNRQRIKRTARNRSIRSEFRGLVKAVREAVAGGDSTQAKKTLAAAVSALDGAVTAGVLHRATASRQVSRLSVAVHKLGDTRVSA